MVDTLNTRFINCLHCKIIVVTDVMVKYFQEYSTTFVAKYLYESDVLIHMLLSSLLGFH